MTSDEPVGEAAARGVDINRRTIFLGGVALGAISAGTTVLADPPMLHAHLHGQPLGGAGLVQVGAPFAQVQLALAYRIFAVAARLGEPWPEADLASVRALESSGRIDDAANLALNLMNHRAILAAAVNPEARLTVSPLQRRVELVQGGWRSFLIRIDNPGLVPGRFNMTSPNALPVNGTYPPGSKGYGPMGPTIRLKTDRGDIELRWLDMDLMEAAPLGRELEATPFDFKFVSLYARDSGHRSAAFRLDLGSGSAALSDRDSVTLDFVIAPATTITFGVTDHDGRPTTASFLVTDALGRIYPSQVKRSPPDMFFQKKIYRQSGETLTLPVGDYTVAVGRGPEYRVSTERRTVGNVAVRWDVKLERWINPADFGWYSGDTHVHAAGCAHYAEPEEGVGPEMLIPQVKGEGLALASVLTWGPGFYTQKLNFTGRDNPVSTPENIMHYDLEVSGFPSSHCGHLVMLRMKAMDYPGTTRIEQWPSSNAPVLRWGRSQGALNGYAHSGLGLWSGSNDVPYSQIPPFDSIGANDFIVTLPEGLVDFMNIGNQPPASELTIWYHTLNVGLRPRIGGETDWPCIYEESMGMGRSYVKLDGPLTYEGWLDAFGRGRCYVSEGRAHLMDFTVSTGSTTVELGGPDLEVKSPQGLKVSIKAAALLAPEPTPATEAIRKRDIQTKPHWHVERARIGDSRELLAELVVNGRAVASQRFVADGSVQALSFDYRPPASCWIAVRVLGVAHTNPIWITVAGGQIRVKQSAQWCRRSVDQCWSQKKLRIRDAELTEEAALYDRGRRFYDRMIAESGGEPI